MRIEFLIDPSIYRRVNDIVKGYSSNNNNSRLEILRQCVYEEGEAELESELRRKEHLTSTSTSSTTNSKNNIHNENASGIFYDIGHNEHGMRLEFQGMSQILDKYVHAFCRKLADHSMVVTIDQKKMESSITNLSRMNSQRYTKWQIAKAIRESSPQDVSDEAKAFWSSCVGNGGVAIAQGDILPTESMEILSDFRNIFRLDSNEKRSQDTDGKENVKEDSRSQVLRPPMKTLLYRPNWKPRMTSCFIPGIRLISDACGRVPR